MSRVSSGLRQQTGLTTKGVREGSQDEVTWGFKDGQKLSWQKRWGENSEKPFYRQTDRGRGIALIISKTMKHSLISFLE